MLNKLLKFWLQTSYWKKLLIIYLVFILIPYFYGLISSHLYAGVFNCGDIGGECSFWEVTPLIFAFIFIGIAYAIKILIVEARLPLFFAHFEFSTFLVYLALLSIPITIAYGLKKSGKNVAATIALSPLAALLIYYVYRFLF